jgi:Putative stress-induced transcription regulator
MFVTSLHLRCSLGRPIRSLRSQVLVEPFCVTPSYGYSLRSVMKPVKVVTVTFVNVGGRECLNFGGTRKRRRTPAPEELLTQPKLLPDWAVQAGLLDRGIEVAGDDLEAAIALRERPSIGPLPPGLRAVGPSPLTLSYSTSTDPTPNSRLGWTEPALSAGRGPHRSCSRAWRRIYSTCSPDPTSRRSRVAPIRGAAACVWIRRAHKIGIGGGWAPVATRPKCERSGNVSEPPNRRWPASARAGRRGSRR